MNEDESSSSSSDEFDEELEVDFEEMLPRRMSRGLIPAEVEDEVVGVMLFTDEFRSRYGRRRMPLFCQSSFGDALHNSVLLPPMDKTLLAVYLHHDDSILSNIFSSQVLCSESVVEFLATNFVVWGWDLTHEKNKDIVMSQFVEWRIVDSEFEKHLNIQKLPALLVLIRNSRGRIEIYAVISGNSTVQEVMEGMLMATERKKFEEQVFWRPLL